MSQGIVPSYPQQVAVTTDVHLSPDFKTLIQNVLIHYGSIDRKVSEMVYNENAKLFSQAFTSSSMNSEKNYEVYEQLGDIACNHAIVNYAYKKFPELNNNPAGVAIVSRIRIRWGSKECMCKFANQLRFWPFISASSEYRSTKKKHLLEDVFESFCGLIEMIFDTKYGTGAGYSVVYSILSKILDRSNISLKYEDLWDPITRRKELIEYYFLRKPEAGLQPIINVFKREGDSTVCEVYMYRGGKYPIQPNGKPDYTKSIRGNPELLITAKGSTQDDSNMRASELLITKLTEMGFTKPYPEIYEIFVKGCSMRTITTDHTPESLRETLRGLGIGINDLYQHEMKSNKFHIPVIKRAFVSQFCKIKNYKGVKACMENGCDLNILDTAGYSIFDLLFTDCDQTNEKEVKEMKMIIKRIKDAGKANMHIGTEVYELYKTHPAIVKYGKCMIKK
jgi:dsRNA-specific ribonuclease